VVRYADDLVALCHSAEQAQQVKDRLARWLTPRGLAFNETKTRVVGLEDGFDFLGFNIRRYRNGKLLIKPSNTAVQRIRRRLAAEVKALHGANAEAVINKLNPIIRGWAAYYRTVVSKVIFSALDHYVWVLTYRWARRAHPNKGKGQVLLDPDRPSHSGQGPGVSGRPDPDRLLGYPAPAWEATTGTVPDAPATCAEWTVPGLR
jgi:RNA-directed DNA polymerase